MVAPVVVHPPVRGQWAIFNPPGHPKLAFDLLAVDEHKSPYKGVSLARHALSRITVEDTFAWGLPVYAALSGTVVVAADGAPDRHALSMLRDLGSLLFFGPKVAPPFSNLGGNYVVLDCGGIYPLYAHLRCGSVLVKAGQSVAAGEPLAEVGNSGSSLQPHLHFQVMSSAEPFPLFRNLLPMLFSKVRCKQRGQWHQEAVHAPRNGDHLLVEEAAA